MSCGCGAVDAGPNVDPGGGIAPWGGALNPCACCGGIAPPLTTTLPWDTGGGFANCPCCGGAGEKFCGGTPGGPT